MADYYKCSVCDAKLLGITGVKSSDLGPCPNCDANAWGQVVKVGTVTEHDTAMPIRPVAQRIEGVTFSVSPTFPRGELIQQGPYPELPSDEELVEVDVDAAVMALVMFPPTAADPEDPWIAQLGIDGQWDYVYRVTKDPEEALEDALIRFSEYLKDWWNAIQQRRQRES